MKMEQVFSTIVAPALLGLGGGVLTMYANLNSIETRQEEIKEDLNRVDDEVLLLREDIKELNRFLRDALR